MGATFNRLKNWVEEILSYADLNAEIDNILNNLTPVGVDDLSSNAAAMQTTKDPYPSQTIDLAESLAEEIQHLRYQILQILGAGATYWYEDPTISLSTLFDSAFALGLPASYVASGPTRALSNFSDFIVPDSTSASCTVDVGAGLVYFINNTRYEATADITVSGLTSGPTSNQTALVNDTIAAGQHYTTYTGEHGTYISVDNVGSEVTAVVDTLQSFKISDGTEVEYFTGEYTTTGSEGNRIHKCRRGNFYSNPVDVAWNRFAYSNNDTITLCRTAWLFISTTQTVAVTYNAPTYSFEAPTSPSIGDYWFDQTLTLWKRYTAGGWVPSNSVLIGYVVMDGANCKAARSVDVYKQINRTNTLELEVPQHSNQTLVNKNQGGVVNVYGTTYTYGWNSRNWNVASGGDLIAGSVANNTRYYVYLDDDGEHLLGTEAPHDRVAELGGYYHPRESWRCIGYAETNGSAQFIPQSVVNFRESQENTFFGMPRATKIITVSDDYSSTTSTQFINAATDGTNDTVVTLDNARLRPGHKVVVRKSDNNFIPIDIQGADGTTITNAVTYQEVVTLMSDGFNYVVVDRWYPKIWTDYSVTITGTTTNPTKATTTLEDQGQWYRLTDNSVVVRYDYQHTNNSGATAGSGSYGFSIPSGLTIDTSKVKNSGVFNMGSAFAFPGAAYYGAPFYLGATANVGLNLGDNTQNFTMGSAAGAMTNSTIQISFKAEIPISGWPNG